MLPLVQQKRRGIRNMRKSIRTRESGIKVNGEVGEGGVDKLGAWIGEGRAGERGLINGREAKEDE